MAIDWTTIDLATQVGFTGTVEYRVENDGLVRWRGNVTITIAGYYAAYIHSLPVECRPLDSWLPLHVGWSGTPDKRNLYMQADSQLTIGNFVPVDTAIDLNPFSYQGIVPPPAGHSLVNVQAGLADALRNIIGLRVYDFPSDRIEPPAAVLSLPETPYDITLGGRSDEWTFPLWILIAKADDKASYGEMVNYLEADGLKSIRAMIEVDRSLGGACDTAAVVRARPLFATIAGTEFLAVEFTLEVYT